MQTRNQPTQPRPEGEQGANDVFVGAGLGSLQGAQQVLRTWVITSTDTDPIATIESIVTLGERWVILLPYELGGGVEPTARSTATDLTGFPLAVLMQLGDTNDAVSSFASEWSISPLESSMGRARYEHAVERVLEYIAAGDIYQANIAHHLSGAFVGDPIACARRLIGSLQPKYGALMSFQHLHRSHTICSISPELFLRYDASTRMIESQPMKGTRPLDADAAELASSDKDRAELNMITDLMRNDLGRICALGSVRVHDPRRIEPHGSGVIQASSIVRGQMRGGVGLAELIRATFPPGSVTGAPKVRAMQIIDELEQRPRNAYCGSIMHIDPAGSIECSVAIRTAHIWGGITPDGTRNLTQGRFEYPVGAGIVADSDPASEWAETLVKAGALTRSLGLALNHMA